ncbi:MAG: hypothetical protein NXI32_08130 [bacterium]|nr:hypothetical protein [bacterium]
MLEASAGPQTGCEVPLAEAVDDRPGSTAAAATCEELFRELGPCVPLRDNWYARRIRALQIAVLTAGLLLGILAIPRGEQILVPGSLASQHAQILSPGLDGPGCAECHPQSHSAFVGARTQDELCLHCHGDHLTGPNTGNPHDISWERLNQITRRSIGHPPSDLPVNFIAGETRSGERLESPQCATCHQEHQGSLHSLTRLSDQRCQACHRQKFTSFLQGHPQFKNYPESKPHRIAFDHSRHAEQHFAKQGVRFDCAGCHVRDDRQSAVGSVFRTLSFEKACASCHASAIGAAITEGWIAMQLPSLDLEDLTSKPSALAEWPNNARFGYQGNISPLLMLLLASDPQALQAIGELPGNGELGGVIAERRPQIARGLALAIRSLITEIDLHGSSAWKRRMRLGWQTALGREVSERESWLIDELSHGLSKDLFSYMRRLWFLDAANSQRRDPQKTFAELQVDSSDGISPSTHGNQDAPLLGDDLAEGAIRDSSELSALLAPQVEAPGMALEAAEVELLLGGPLAEEDDLWLESEKSTEDRVDVTGRGLDESRYRGWYLDEQLLSLNYAPSGHADRVMAAWIELTQIMSEEAAADVPAVDDGNALDLRRHLLSQQKIFTQCVECHQLVGKRTAGPWSRWQAVNEAAGTRRFTHFDHRPHLTLAATRDCKFCHVLQSSSHEGKPEPDFSLLVSRTKSEAGDDATSHVPHSGLGKVAGPDFGAISLQQCVTCHRPGGSEDACTLCHYYHIDASALSW